MNKRRFIERLNLFLDGELSTEEAEKLLAATRRNPEYHRIYLQYCQINQACATLGETFTSSPGSRSLIRQRIYAVGGMAAAVALLALAAQNLSPIIGTDPGASSNGFADAGATGSPISAKESLVVLNVNDLPESGDFDTPRFDIEKTFKPVYARSGVFGAPQVQQASFRVDQPEAELSSPWNRGFRFGQAVNASTFEHELLSSRDGAANALHNREAGSAYDSDEVRGATTLSFDLERSMSAPLQRVDSSKVGVTAER